MKKALALILSLALVLALAACGTTAATPTAAPATAAPTAAAATAAPSADPLADLDPIQIVFATPNGATNIESVYAQKWMELVTERSGGKITFDYTNAGALGSYAELLEGVQNGVYDLTITEPSYVQTYVPESVVLSLPMIYSDYDQATAILDGEVGTTYQQIVEDSSNLKLLNFFYCGFRYVCSEKPIKSLADCKGVLIRSPQIDTYTDLLGLMGFSYVTMAFSEAYTAMQTGVIEAVEVPLQNIYEAGFYNLGKYVCATRHLLSVNCITANKDFWNSLPQAYADLMETALQEVTADERTQCQTNETDYVTKLEAEGVTFTEFDDASKTELLKIFTDYWNTKVSALNSPTATDLLNKILAIKNG